MLSDFNALAVVVLALAANVNGHGGHKKRQNNPAALNPQLTAQLPLNGGPQLYYNGSGPVPPYNMTSPVPVAITPLNSTSAIADNFFAELTAIVADNATFPSNCSKCVAGAELIHLAAITQPVSTVTDLLIRACNLYKFQIYAATCEAEFAGIGGIGPYLAQLFAKMSYATGDYQAFCYYNYNVCTEPPVIEIDESKYFSPKPEGASVTPAPSGKSIEVLHLSDYHLDPRYDIGSEANCSQYLCCRPYATNKKLHTTAQNASIPASRFGALFCDSPADLALSAFDDMGKFLDKSSLAFAIFTGDIVSHDNADQLSRAYVEYEETVTYQTFKAQMGDIPVYPTLGNHDSLPEAFTTPNTFNGPTGNAIAWNYNLLSSLWSKYKWISESEADYASTHYGAYAHTTAQGLRIISINTDFWYVANVYNYANFSNPDPSGMLAFLAAELTACEARGQRAWVIGHVLSGYDGSQALPNPSALFQSIVIRFSPATIAGVFFGHTHEEQFQIFYEYSAGSLKNGSRIRNTTDVNYDAPLQVGYIGPSVTPLTGNNAGYTVLQVDARTFSVMGSQTYIANMSESLTWSSPEWQFEYDLRREYTLPSNPWPAKSPLNATFIHGLTKAMQANISLVERYNLLETKSSVLTRNCSSAACQEHKVCIIRSGSSAIGRACLGSGPF